MKKKNILTALIIILLIFLNGCILEDFDTVPINIPISLPVYLVDDGSSQSLESEAAFCLDSNTIYIDYEGKIKEVSLVEVAFRFTNVTPSNVAGNMQFALREVSAAGNILIDQSITNFSPDQFKVPQAPFILDLSPAQLQLMNGYLTRNGTCFYGFIAIENLTPAATPKLMVGYVDMLFKAEVEF